MKRYGLVFVALLIGSLIFGQAYKGEGDLKLNAGLSAYGYGSGLSGSINYGILDWMSVGAGADIYFRNKDENDDQFFVYGRANFHLGTALNLSDEWDIYPGVNLGIIGNSFGFGAYVGARYFFNEKLGIYTELGNHGSLGVSINL